MKKSYCIICGKNIKFEKSKISYIFEKTIVVSIVCSKCKNEDEKIFKERRWNEDEKTLIEILKIISLIGNRELFLGVWLKNLDWKI